MLPTERRLFTPPALLVLVATLLTARAATAGVDRWSGHGPPGGRVSSLAVAATAPSRLWAGVAGGGVFASRDGGASWHPASRGLASLEITPLAADPERPGHLWAGTLDAGLYESRDGGGSWQAVAGLEGERIKALLADRGTLYTGTASGRVVAGPTRTSELTPLVELPAPVFSLAVGPGPEPALWVGTADGIFVSRDGGESFRDASAGLPERFVKRIAVDPRDRETVWAGTGGGLLVSTDAARSWRRVGGGLPPVEVRSLVFDGEVIHAGTAAGLFTSRDRGRSWHGGAAGLPRLEVLALARAGADLHVATGGAGIFTSRDRARHFTPANRGLAGTSVPALALDPDAADAVLAGVTGQGVMRSVDGGRSWQRLGRPPGPGPILAVARLPSPTGLPPLLAGLATAGLRRSTDGGATWQSPAGLPGGSVVDLELSPGDGERVWAVLLGHGPYLSEDAGASWRAATGGALLPHARDLAVDPTDPAHLLLAAGPRGVLVSRDGGSRWQRHREDLPGTVEAVAVLPGALLAGGGGRVVASRDDGVSWQPVGDGVLPGDVRDLVAADGQILAATTAGVFATRSGGAPWRRLGPGLAGLHVLALAADPAVPGRVWAATNGRGVFGGRFVGAAPLALAGGRFELEAAWRGRPGMGGAALPGPASPSSGVLTFRPEGPPEVLVKLLELPRPPGWSLFVAPATSRGVTVTVTEPESGRSETVSVPPGTRRTRIVPLGF